MNYDNQVILRGRLVRDPELRYTTTGKAVCSFTLAVDRGWKKDEKDGKGEADFIKCQCWDKLAEAVANNNEKGSPVMVFGSIRTGSYEKDGQKHYTTEVVANKATFLGPNTTQRASESDAAIEDVFGDVSPEDVPF